MKNRLIGLASTLVLTLGMASTANATPIDMLIDRGNGMIYDTHQDITWLQDANYAQTSGYDADGRMSWTAATDWAANLSFGGYDDWRLATVTVASTVLCPPQSNSGTNCGYSVITDNSELAYMWYDILGNTPTVNASGFAQSGGLSSTSADGVDILNLESGYYWTGTEYAPNTLNAWRFDTSRGLQNRWGKDSFNSSFFTTDFYAWAVRSGDVGAAAVPSPGTLLLLAAGLVGIAGAKRRRC